MFSALKPVITELHLETLEQNMLTHRGQVGSNIRPNGASTFQFSVCIWQLGPLRVLPLILGGIERKGMIFLFSWGHFHSRQFNWTFYSELMQANKGHILDANIRCD